MNDTAPPRAALKRFLRELAALLCATSVAVLLLWYLHGLWQPGWAVLCGFLAASVLPRLVRPNYADFPPFLRQPVDIGVMVVGTILFSWATLARQPSSYWLLRWREAVTLPIVAAALGLGLAGAIYSHARMRREIEQARAREAALREATLRAQLRALQAQINPHFLFNAFNAAAELTHDDPASAEQLIGDLAHLLRYSLRSSATGTVPLVQELETIDRYLRIEQIRLGDRLRFARNIEPGAENLQIPGLVLQPLVENAVQHAIAPRTDGGAVSLTVRRVDAVAHIVVQDDGPGMPEAIIARLQAISFDEPHADSFLARGSGGAGGGLANVAQRLALGYRGAASLSVQRLDPGTRIELRIPA